jgi:hypothetical protein
MAFRYRPRYRPRVWHALIAVSAAVLAVLAPGTAKAASAGPLPSYDITGVYVAGVSSGGFLATQLQVAYSGTSTGPASSPPGPTTAAKATSSTSRPATWASATPSWRRRRRPGHRRD